MPPVWMPGSTKRNDRNHVASRSMAMPKPAGRPSGFAATQARPPSPKARSPKKEARPSLSSGGMGGWFQRANSSLIEV